MRALLEESFRAAVAAADPRAILAAHLPPAPRGRTYVAAAGKAAASMAAAVEEHWRGEFSGIAITRYGHGVPTKPIRVVEAGHPVPDEAGEAAAREILVRYRIDPPASVKARLEKAADETPKPGDPVFARVQNKVIATAHRSLEAAAAVFANAGVQPVILGDTVTGEAAEVAKVMAALVYEVRKYQKPWKPPVALISGGE